MGGRHQVEGSPGRGTPRHGRPVALLPTCLIDALGPGVRSSLERVLSGVGDDARVPAQATCCGQPAFNAGDLRAARRVAAASARALDGTEGPVVVPSGSCTAMIRLHWPELLAGTRHGAAAERVSARAVELSEHLHAAQRDPTSGARPAAAPTGEHGEHGEHGGLDGGNGDDGDGPQAPLVAHHVSCHLLRHLGVRSEPVDLLARHGYRVVGPDDEDRCCGFGGTFSVAYPEVSVAMADDKLDALAATGAGVVAGCDLSCLAHLDARARHRSMDLRFAHLAELLDEAPVPAAGRPGRADTEGGDPA